MLQGTVRRVDGFATVAPNVRHVRSPRERLSRRVRSLDASRNLCLGGRECLKYKAKGCESFRQSLGIDGPTPAVPVTPAPYDAIGTGVLETATAANAAAIDAREAMIDGRGSEMPSVVCSTPNALQQLARCSRPGRDRRAD